MANSRPEESPLSSILGRDDRAHLVVLIGSITSTIHEKAALGVNNPQKSRSILWLNKWQETVISRVSEAANSRWEPLKTSKPRDWDELSWDEPTPKEAEVDTSLHSIYPPFPTPLVTLDNEKRLLILHSVLLILLSLKHYYAPSRLLLVNLASSLNLTLTLLDHDEKETAATLLSAAKEMSAQEEVEQKAKENQSARRWKVGLASVAGAAVIGLTGGLAAPLVAAGLGTVLGGLGLGATAAAGLLGSLAGSSVLVGGLFGAYGAKMTSGMVDQYAREVSDFKFIPVRKGDERRLRVTIAISGWLNEKQDVLKPWRVLGTGTEVFALRWELDTLLNLGSGLSELVTSTAWNVAKVEILKRTVFASLLGAVMLPLGLIKLGSLVDNPFRVAKSRADKAGEVLADALVNRAQGERPVALLGYSLGARVIQSCLLSLQKRKAYGLIDSVIMIGAPIPNDAAQWQAMRTMVAGRLINVYSENDYVLGFLYRANSVQVGVAGLSRVEAVGVENKDVSDLVDGHLRYKVLIGRILNEVGWQDLDGDELMHEHELLKMVEVQEAKALERAQAKKEQAEMSTEENDLISNMNTKALAQRPASISPPPMPSRPNEGSTHRLGAQFGSKNMVNTSKNPKSPTGPYLHPSPSSVPSCQPPKEHDAPLIDLLAEPDTWDQQSNISNTIQSHQASKPQTSTSNQVYSPHEQNPPSKVSSNDHGLWSEPFVPDSTKETNSNFLIKDEPVKQLTAEIDALARSSTSIENSCHDLETTVNNRLIEDIPASSSKAVEASVDSDNDSDEEPKFRGITMVDNDPNLL